MEVSYPLEVTLNIGLETAVSAITKEVLN